MAHAHDSMEIQEHRGYSSSQSQAYSLRKSLISKGVDEQTEMQRGDEIEIETEEEKEHLSLIDAILMLGSMKSNPSSSKDLIDLEKETSECPPKISDIATFIIEEKQKGNCPRMKELMQKYSLRKSTLKDYLGLAKRKLKLEEEDKETIDRILDKFRKHKKYVRVRKKTFKGRPKPSKSPSKPSPEQIMDTVIYFLGGLIDKSPRKSLEILFQEYQGSGDAYEIKVDCFRKKMQTIEDECPEYRELISSSRFGMRWNESFNSY